ncbi:cytochrome c-type biogenesis protein CcsB [Kineosphaera limosa]|uniref:Cytochrome c biogenesis protein ResC n=1 Tax=Kineosphaera limosa NBRC 100340 TaxID=1184609 RepID=K6VDE7_9MICO|nr:c-type cytochrome biogenesis protein CcsB [Kineosphaera limosa]NYE02792.1 cytochrome c-type biogenesis protein CcsB [Kineosphaera limosa]GAB94223.1 cytochrome c biogenesis protein ResC [Kineosphaera limosa NBRC 100340]
MFDISQYALLAATGLVAIAVVAHVVIAVRYRRHEEDRSTQRPRSHAMAGGPATPGSGTGPEAVDEFGNPLDAVVGYDPDRGAGSSDRPFGLVWYAEKVVQLAAIFLSINLVTRAITTGHGPWANQHEFAVAFSWGILVAYVLFAWRYRVRMLGLVVLPVALAMLIYADTVEAQVRPLVPALHNNLMLTIHVACAVLAYGAGAVAFGAAVMYLVHPHVRGRGLPSRQLLDEIGYRSAIVTYPLLTVMIILGAVWANVAWGRYWSWDPKETAALVTWLIYGAYLHARVARDWRGERAAWLLILGFVAILFTYFGNLFLGGLHSYA